MPSSSNVLVLGGGISGMTAALSLAKRGAIVHLVERAPSLGGNGLKVCCKAIDGECQLCGGCLLGDALQEIARTPDILIETNATVARVERRDGGFVYRTSGDQDDRLADAVIVATGFQAIDARTKGPYGWGQLPMVVTGREMEEALVAKGRGAWDERLDRGVAFVQCVGSRDEHAGRGYCSQVCCRYAMRLARYLRWRRSDVAITIFKMDMQHTGRDTELVWDKVAGDVRFVSGLPAVIRRAADDPTLAEFLIDDTTAVETRRETFGLVVLSNGIEPQPDAGVVADLFGLTQDDFGFLATDDDEVSTIAPGVFAAGCCQAPRSIAASAFHARQAAEACASYLGGAHA
ncbi:MAG: FAD-dependent oxidoreductase [Anaerolineae bacterium]